MYYPLKLTVFTLLFPLLLLQGIYVKLVTPRLPEAAGDRNGTSAHLDKQTNQIENTFSLLLLGDSAAAGVGVAHQSQGLLGQLVKLLSNDFNICWQLIARSGVTSLQTIDYLEKQPATSTDLVIISLGVNDVISWQSEKTWLKHQQRLVKLLKHQFSAKMILFNQLPPMHLFPALPQPLRWVLGTKALRFNQLLVSLVSQQHHCYLLSADLPMTNSQDINQYMASDGFHPGIKGYQMWAQVIAIFLKTQINPKKDLS